MVVDHKDNNPSNNRKENLRICTQQQNSFNAKPHKDNKYSNHKGVSLLISGDRKKPWRARVYVDGREKHFGYFYTEQEAYEVVNKFYDDYHGEFKHKQ